MSDVTFEHVRTTAELDRFVDRWLPAIDGGAVAFDIEEDREHHYWPQIALMQLTIDGHDAILDPLSLPEEALAPVVEFICMTASEVVMHGCNNDVVGLKRDFGVGPGNLRDTQIAARFIGADSFGLASLLEDRFDIQLDKSVRRSDWTQRPLSDDQIKYARADTSDLLPLWRELEELVEEAGWFDAYVEECMAMADLPPETVEFDPLGWLRIKKVRGLEEIGQRRAAALWRWRDEVGVERDLHPSRILPPWALVQLARRGPSALRSGKKVPGLARSVRDDEHDILDELLSDPPPLPKQPKKSRRRGPRPRDAGDPKARLDALLAWRSDTAEETGLDSGFLAPRSLLEAIARDPIETEEDLAAVDSVRTWRLERYAEEWLSLLRGL